MAPSLAGDSRTSACKPNGTYIRGISKIKIRTVETKAEEDLLSYLFWTLALLLSTCGKDA